MSGLNKFLVGFVFTFLVAGGTCFSSDLDSLMNLYNSESDPVEQGKLLNLISNEYLDIDLEKARMYAMMAIKIGAEQNHYNIESDGNINMGNYFNIKGMLDSNLYHYERSYELCMKSGDKRYIAASLNRLGLVYQEKSLYNRAMEYFLESVSYYQQTENNAGLAHVYNSMAIVNDYLSNRDIALSYYNQALKMHLKSGDSLGIGSVLNNIGELKYEDKDFDSAYYYLDSALTIFDRLNELPSEAILLNNIGSLFLDQGNADSALSMHKKALELQEKLDNKLGMGKTYQQMAHVFQFKKDYAKAKEYMFKSLRNREFVGNLQAKYTNFKDLSELYEEMGQKDSALYYFKEYAELKDSVLGLETQTKVNELQQQFESAEKDKQILILEREAAVKDKEAAKQQKRTIILVISIIILLVIGAILVYGFRTKSKMLEQSKLLSEQQKSLAKLSMEKTNAENELLKQEVQRQQEINKLTEEKYNAELEYKSRELITLTMHIQNKNKALGDIQKALEEMKNVSGTDMKKHTGRLVREISQNINLDEDWEQFKMHFDKVNVGFFDRLQSDFEGLTKNDLKLCAYLKINLSSKEIAQILNISIAGVNKSRNRLRKKLNLTPEVNLTSFILNY